MAGQNQITMGAYNLASTRPRFLAYLLESYCEARQIDHAVLCAGLGIKQNTLWRIGMCMSPTSILEIRKIATQFEIEHEPLIEIWRWANPTNSEIEVLPQTNSHTQEKVNLTALKELLLKDKSSPDQPSSAEEKKDELPELDFQALVKILKEHPLLDARKLAARALALSGEQLAVEPLLEVFKDNGRLAWYMKWHLLDALGRLGNKGAVRSIGEELENFRLVDEDLRVKAIETLGQIGGEEAAEQLIKMLKDEDDNIRFRVIEALGNFDSKPVLDALALVQKSDDDIQNRTKATESLLIIKEHQQERMDK